MTDTELLLEAIYSAGRLAQELSNFNVRLRQLQPAQGRLLDAYNRSGQVANSMLRIAQELREAQRETGE